ncbi:ribonuclease H-like protein [Fadolivirus algeromassiliense]|jgi:hypothetical protein|uniref:Ribonuclease H-like protein n=1 Tax=Fadolivirus FV1/VV64 TaxID=3070911 RepID=A0A7D3UPH7_9VIRU|nr:ribonuclease H-like protein [Fadolivirus algeromassiliense]QKF93948.1 ribonuclease H-like protein [Fadolivirus FV1/VV64]
MDNLEKILGWDVGIKHLAFCIIVRNKTDNTFKIDKWMIIDLTDSDQYKCCGTLKKKNKSDTDDILCGAGASFCSTNNNETKYYCGTHKAQCKIDINEIEKELVKPYDNTTKEKCKFKSARSKKDCNKKAEFIINDCICCKSHKENQLKDKIKQISIKPLKIKKCTSADPQYLCEKMYKKLSEFDDFKNVNRVYIENQPTFINPTMKAVSSMLLSYFVFLFTSNKLENRIVKFVSPSFKLQLDENLIKNIDAKIEDHKKIKTEKCKCRICTLNNELITNKTKFSDKYDKYKFGYDSIKEIGIIYTEKILTDNLVKEDFNKINGYDKKDDLCDAFLHAFRKLKE